jgi:hypothetical protein
LFKDPHLSLKALSNHHLLSLFLFPPFSLFFFDAPKGWVLTFKNPSPFFFIYIYIFVICSNSFSLFFLLSSPMLGFHSLSLSFSYNCLHLSNKRSLIAPSEGCGLSQVFIRKKLNPAQMGITKDEIFRK